MAATTIPVQTRQPKETTVSAQTTQATTGTPRFPDPIKLASAAAELEKLSALLRKRLLQQSKTTAVPTTPSTTGTPPALPDGLKVRTEASTSGDINVPERKKRSIDELLGLARQGQLGRRILRRLLRRAVLQDPAAKNCKYNDLLSTSVKLKFRR